MTHKRTRARMLGRGLALMVAGAMVAPATVAGASPARGFIVQAANADAAAAAVRLAGGRVTLPLGLVHGVAARLDNRAVAALSASGTVKLTPDVAVHPTGGDFGASIPAQTSALNLGLESPDAGEGIGVALVDTGVADLPGHPIRHLVTGPDFSGDSPADGVDHYGHGTFMAGLIAGKGVVAPDGQRYSGVAPGVTLVSVKVAGADGSTSLSRVIAGMAWVVSQRDSLHIRVMNLSLGVEMNMLDPDDPLAGAVEATWASGIAVVASAGNAGTRRITAPGEDPWIITAGAMQTNGPTAAGATTVAWSGTSVGKPDVLAPGVHTVSLRAPGSMIDRGHPTARIGDALFRGSGTSMAAALTSGAAAVVISHHPGANPDDVKGALVSSGAGVAGSTAKAVDVTAAIAAQASPTWVQHHPIAFHGLGLGLSDFMPWAGTWTPPSWTPPSWNGASWTGASWTGASWTGASWTGASWTGASWTGASWTGASWTTQNWD